MVVAAPVVGEWWGARMSHSHTTTTELQAKEAEDSGGSGVCEYGMLLAATTSSLNAPPTTTTTQPLQPLAQW